MAIYSTNLKDNKSKESFDNLKKFLQKRENNKLNEHYPALDYINGLETQIKDLNSELEKYKEFFKILNQCLPKATLFK